MFERLFGLCCVCDVVVVVVAVVAVVVYMIRAIFFSLLLLCSSPALIFTSVSGWCNQHWAGIDKRKIVA